MTYPLIFRHCVTDGSVYIDNATGTQSKYPYDWWITQEPTYVYPDGATYLQYVENGVSGQSYWTNSNSQDALPDDFPILGDGYIAKQSVYDAAYAIHISAPSSLSEAKEIKYGELGGQNATVQQGYITYTTIGSGSQTFFSDNSTFQNLSNDLSLFTPLSVVPSGYTIMNTSFVNIECTLADLADIVKLIQTLYYECRINYDIHYAAISALTTIVGVEAYDITTGWPTVPFTSP